MHVQIVYMNHALTYCNCNIEIVSFRVNVDACFGGKGHDNYLLQEQKEHRLKLAGLGSKGIFTFVLNLILN